MLYDLRKRRENRADGEATRENRGRDDEGEREKDRKREGGGREVGGEKGDGGDARERREGKTK